MKLLIGNFGAKNLGDELILFAATAQNRDFVAMTADEKFSREFCEKEFSTVKFFPAGIFSAIKFLFSGAYFREILELREKISAVVFCGGGLFSIKFRAVFLWFLIFLWCKFFLKNAEIFFENQGVDQNFSGISKKLIRFVFSRADAISVRDERSKIALQNLKIEKKIAVENDRVENFLRQKFPEKNFDKKKLVVCNAREKADFAPIFEKFPQHRKIFVAFEKRDLRVAPPIFGEEIFFPTTAADIFRIFSAAEIAVGQRLHFLICAEFFCGNQKTFFIEKKYSEKVVNFCAKKKILQFFKN